MNCPQCGEPCRCFPEPPSAALPEWMHDAESPSAPPVVHALESAAEDERAAGPAAPDDSWRQELSTRLDRYRSRRKPRPPRYPSLRLQFEEPPRSASSGTAAFETVSDQALALDAMTEAAVDRVEIDSRRQPEERAPAASQPAVRASAKIIAFPRLHAYTPPIPLDELAGPVIERPRILEAPEATPPPPALGGITIDAAHPADAEKQPGIDIPLQSAPLARRIAAAAVDGLIIAAASALSGVIFWKVAGVRPPLVQILGLAAGIPCLYWAAYQYLLLVYSGSTPGLRLAGLELARFDGTPASRRLRRWRVLASYLSAVSLGMGYAWLFLDEDALCWHDRITHTYLAPKKLTR